MKSYHVQVRDTSRHIIGIALCCFLGLMAVVYTSTKGSQTGNNNVEPLFYLQQQSRSIPVRAMRSQLDMVRESGDSRADKRILANVLGSLLALNVAGADQILFPPVVHAEEVSTTSTANIPQVDLYTKRTSDLQQYSDIQRGFKMLRPFGFNEFDGAGTGYAVKFASLFDIDENVVVGSSPGSSGKNSIVDYGDINVLGEKLAAKRKGKLVSAEARQTEGIVFYMFQFEYPVDPTLPRTGPKDKRPTSVVELYQLCVGKGRLWSVQATTGNTNFPVREKMLKASLLSFIPRL